MEIKTDRNIGDIIFFMDGSSPKKSAIIAIETFVGKYINNLGSGRESDLNGERVNITYYVEDNQYPIHPNDVFSNKEDLMAALFKKL